MQAVGPKTDRKPHFDAWEWNDGSVVQKSSNLSVAQTAAGDKWTNSALLR